MYLYICKQAVDTTIISQFVIHYYKRFKMIPTAKKRIPLQTAHSFVYSYVTLYTIDEVFVQEYHKCNVATANVVYRK